MTKKIAVLGAGSWGTALAQVLIDNEHQAILYAKRQQIVDDINQQHINHQYLPQQMLDSRLKATADLSEAVRDCDVLVIAVPSSAIRSICQQLNELLTKSVHIIHVAKGIEPQSLKRVSQMIIEELAPHLLQQVTVLSGPSHAEEVIKRLPTTVVVAAEDMFYALQAQQLFNNHYFRVYTNTDIIGLELGGSLKNIIALGAGMIDGLNYGDNAKAALITRGLAEITRLSIAMGANSLTFLGLAGIGDLVVTCTSKHSRNWQCGYLIGQGKTLQQAVEQLSMVAEGVRTVEAAYQLSQHYHVNMPITTVLYHILYAQADVKEATALLMSRDVNNEMTGI